MKLMALFLEYPPQLIRHQVDCLESIVCGDFWSMSPLNCLSKGTQRCEYAKTQTVFIHNCPRLRLSITQALTTTDDSAEHISN
jgi:hypothetical protein